MDNILLGWFVVITLFGQSCSNDKANLPVEKNQSLREFYKNDFLIGTALNADQIIESDYIVNS